MVATAELFNVRFQYSTASSETCGAPAPFKNDKGPDRASFSPRSSPVSGTIPHPNIRQSGNRHKAGTNRHNRSCLIVPPNRISRPQDAKCNDTRRSHQKTEQVKFSPRIAHSGPSGQGYSSSMALSSVDTSDKYSITAAIVTGPAASVTFIIIPPTHPAGNPLPAVAPNVSKSA